MVGEDKSVDLGMGTIRASFQSAGKVLFLKERLNRVVKLGVTEVIVALNEDAGYKRGVARAKMADRKQFAASFLKCLRELAVL